MRCCQRILAAGMILALVFALSATAQAGQTQPDWDMTPLPEAYFDDAVFMGDSVSVLLGRRSEETGSLGQALFLAENSYSVFNALYGEVQIWYQGEKYFPEVVLQKLEAGKLFLMLGLNDIDPYGIDGTMDNWLLLTDRIKAANPRVQIFIQSMLPIWYGVRYAGLNNDNILLYNDRLRAFCEETGYVFVDIDDYFRDDTGGLADMYCSDGYVHVTTAATDLWAEQLKNPANYSVDPRLYT